MRILCRFICWSATRREDANERRRDEQQRNNGEQRSNIDSPIGLRQVGERPQPAGHLLIQFSRGPELEHQRRMGVVTFALTMRAKKRESADGEAESSLGLIRYPCPCDMSDDMTELLFT